MKVKKVTPHILRHTAAMRMLQAGVDQASIALWLGHESIKTTYIYLSADIEMKKNILQKLPPFDSKTSHLKSKDKTMEFFKKLARFHDDDGIGPKNAENKRKKKV